MSSIEADALSGRSPNGSRRRLDPAVAKAVVGFTLYVGLLSLAWLALARFTPEYMAVSIAGHTAALTHVRHHVLSYGVKFGVLFPGFLVVEMAITGWRDSSLRRLAVLRTASSRSDLIGALFWETKLINPVILLMTFGAALASGGWLHARIAALTGVSLSVAAWPLWAQLPPLFLAFSFFDYWNHRLDHWHYFWPIHRFHHAADDFCTLTASRVHPALFTGMITGVGPSLLLGASPEAWADLILAMALLRYVIHSRIDSNFGWVGRWVIQSPNHHRLHHVRDISLQKVGHFSLAPIWDHLFGTWRGEADQSLAIGVDAPYRHGAWVWPDLWRDYCDCLNRVWRGVTRQPRLPEPTSTPS